VSILIFSIGALAIVSMQASAAKDSTQAKSRSEASLLVDDLIGRMWASDRSPAALGADFQAGGMQFNDWLAHAQSVLPEIDADGTSVAVTAVPGAPGANPTSQVVVTLAWKARNDENAQRHHVTSVTQISH
jgi:type IV pilus assembly protein PilV